MHYKRLTRTGVVGQCCAEPGWGAAWDSAIAAEVENPGADPAVISDGMILTAVQLRLGAAT